MGRIVLGISGASGMPLAEVLLRALAHAGAEIHLVISNGAREVMREEDCATPCVSVPASAASSAAPSATPSAASFAAPCPHSGMEARLCALAHSVLAPADIAAGPASGSWPHDGMIVCPCSMASLAAIAHGTGSNLLHRAADVTLKERRPLILIPRETPLSRIHLRNMLDAQEAGAVIMPFCPAFYGRPQSIDDLLEHMAGRVLDQLAIPHNLGHPWKG